MTFTRYVALGDSFTEGVGDDAPQLPNGVRGWADRVAEALDDAYGGVEYANLAIRGLKLRPIVVRQVPSALAMKPDLVSIHAGGNDILRPRVDLDDLLTYYDDAVARLTESGATVVLFTPHDPAEAPLIRRLRGRFAIFAEGIREIADRRGAVLVDYWRIRDYDDPRMWAFDRLHMSPAGHQRMAIAVLDALGVPHDLAPLELPDMPARSRRDDLRWTRGFLAPWLGRRLRGVSSGDTLAPRYGEPTAVATITTG
ncbi:SGNH/GDSL hydrolase family protein [Gordonia sp. (in: high G+C Gram-positive bacteria)]|uniref:SGNH/GDSL hydrolase family protein n=1 Tax=Gordonia sp. (in: high G+C Gram-positive bacteria) TaxID=84139 RepID=UPI0026021B6B|nr:SGNH/GDSL hydrolase family protein [Gordonia sp. (in: high G+C Gram-positive bacteria)]